MGGVSCHARIIHPHNSNILVILCAPPPWFSGELIYIKGTKSEGATTIVLRGANEYMLDEMDRALHDSLMVVKRVLESKQLVAGGGSVEAALSIYLENFATTLGSREQLAIAEVS